MCSVASSFHLLFWLVGWFLGEGFDGVEFVLARVVS